MVDPVTPEITLPQLPPRTALVNVDRTPTTAFLRWLQGVADRLKATTDAIIDGDIPAGDVTPGTVDIDDLISTFRNEVGVILGKDGGGAWGRIQELRDQLEQLANDVTSLGGIANSWNVKVEAKLGKAAASVQQQYLALTTSDQALAQSLLSLEATFNTNYSSALAAIAAESTARADADGALAVDVTELVAQYNDATANGFARFEVAAGPAGASASYQIALRKVVAGVTYSGGIRFDLIGTEMVVFVNADLFVVGDNDTTGTAPFFVSGGSTFIANAFIVNLDATNIKVKQINADSILIDDTIITDLLANNAAVKVDFAFTAANTTYTSETTVQTLAFTPVDGKVLVQMTAGITVTGSASTVLVRLYRAGVLQSAQAVTLQPSSTCCAIVSYLDTAPGTTSVSWTLTCERSSGTGTCNANQRTIQCTNFKKQV